MHLNCIFICPGLHWFRIVTYMHFYFCVMHYVGRNKPSILLPSLIYFIFLDFHWGVKKWETVHMVAWSSQAGIRKWKFRINSVEVHTLSCCFTWGIFFMLWFVGQARWKVCCMRLLICNNQQSWGSVSTVYWWILTSDYYLQSRRIVHQIKRLIYFRQNQLLHQYMEEEQIHINGTIRKSASKMKWFHLKWGLRIYHKVMDGPYIKKGIGTARKRFLHICAWENSPSS